MMSATRYGVAAGDLIALVYELLDALADTTELAEEPHDELRWAVHMDYLRALQRTGREALAHSAQPIGAGPGPSKLR